MNIKIKANLSNARMESFYRFHFLYKSSFRILEFALIIFSLVISVLGILLNNTYIFAIFLVMSLIILFTRKYRISSIAKKFIKKNPPKGEPYTITIREGIISYYQNTNIRTYNMTTLKCVCEIDECFYLYVEESMAVIIPKYLLKFEEKENLREYFKKNCSFKQYRFISSTEPEGAISI